MEAANPKAVAARVQNFDATPVVEKVHEIIASGKDLLGIMRALRGEFGDFYLPAMVFRTVRDAAGDFDAAEQQAEEEIARTALARVAEAMLNLERWRQTFSEDPGQYREGLDTLGRAIRAVINRYCGAEAHRPKEEQERDDIIAEMRWSHDWSYAQIAREYKLKTALSISPNSVERICSRHAANQTERLIRHWRPDVDLATLLKAFNLEICHSPATPGQALQLKDNE
jgi:hypothetical protein